MKKIFAILIVFSSLFLMQEKAFARGIGDPGASLKKGAWALSPEFSGVGREIRDGDGVRYDTESWRLLLSGSYGVTDWLEGVGRLGGHAQNPRDSF